jgi:hypothetical protein
LDTRDITQRDFLVPLIYELASTIPFERGILPLHMVHYVKEKKKCRNCYKTKGRNAGSTTYKCFTCNVWLHPKCFIEYHEKIFVECFENFSYVRIEGSFCTW